MPRPQTATNPFYLLLVVVGILFVVTCFAYLTMTVRDARADAAATGLMRFVARHGLTALVAELVLLAVATIGAIGTDGYWNRRRQFEE